MNSHIQIVPSTPIVSNMARYAPLALPSLLHDMPHNYDKRIQRYGAEGEVTTKHLAKINDILDLWEIDHGDINMRILA